MSETLLSSVAFGLLTASFIIQIIFMYKRATSQDPISHYIILGAGILLLINIIIRSFKIHFVAVTNTFEAIILFASALCFTIFIYRKVKKSDTIPVVVFGATILSAVLLAVASSPLIPSDVAPPVPALQSYWLVLHVIFAFIGEAFFTVAFVASIYYLAVKDEEKKRNADRTTYLSIIIGYFFYVSGGLIFGAIWANSAWGSYWSWDPKETWALVTVLIYTLYLHLRLIMKWKGKTMSIISIIGFLVALFTFFGVNYLLGGLHSY